MFYIVGNDREKKRKELMDARNHRILPTPYPNQGPTPVFPNNIASTQSHIQEPTPYHPQQPMHPQASFPGPTPHPIEVQSSASTIAYSAYQPYSNNQQQGVYSHKSAAEIPTAKDKAYNYDYIIGQGEKENKKKTNDVLPFMNGLQIQEVGGFIPFCFIIMYKRIVFNGLRPNLNKPNL